MGNSSQAEASREALQGLIDTLLRGIILDEGCARELAEIAHRCRQDGNHETSERILAVCRNHRIKGMEGRARIAAMRERYAGILGLV